jgi:hypothetical protein
VFLRSEDHAAAGAVATLAQMWALTQRWYAGRLEPAFRRKRPDEYQRMLDDVGLTGEFWALS